MEKEYLKKIEIFAFQCLKCDHLWIPRVELSQLKNGVKEEPIICPSCKSAYWNKQRKNKSKKAKKQKV